MPCWRCRTARAREHAASVDEDGQVERVSVLESDRLACQLRAAVEGNGCGGRERLRQPVCRARGQRAATRRVRTRRPWPASAAMPRPRRIDAARRQQHDAGVPRPCGSTTLHSDRLCSISCRANSAVHAGQDGGFGGIDDDIGGTTRRRVGSRDVARVKLHPARLQPRHVQLPTAPIEIVHRHDVRRRPPGLHGDRQVRSDEPGTACDEDPHLGLGRSRVGNTRHGRLACAVGLVQLGEDLVERFW